MTPKEKAIELVKLFVNDSEMFGEGTTWEYDKQCALICINEMFGENNKWLGHFVADDRNIELEQIKQEIEKL